MQRRYGDKKFSGSKDFAALTNIEQWARTTEHYTFYRKANNIKVTNGIPDSDGATCFYVRMGSYVLCNRASDNSFWFAGFYNDVLTGWTELTSGTVKRAFRCMRKIRKQLQDKNLLPA